LIAIALNKMLRGLDRLFPVSIVKMTDSIISVRGVWKRRRERDFGESD
jgi:hypothetical protein